MSMCLKISQSCCDCLDSTHASKRVHSKCFVILKILLWFGVALLIGLSMILQASCYKSFDVISSVKTRVTSSLLYNDHTAIINNGVVKHYRSIMQLWSNAEYLTPSIQGGIFIPTNAVITENQTLTFGKSNISCTTFHSLQVDDINCKNGTSVIDETGTVIGVTTGLCVQSNTVSNYTCQTYGWNPPEKESLEPSHENEPIIPGLEELKIFIKNVVHFVSRPQSTYSTNFMSNDLNPKIELPKCIYDKRSHSSCPVFKLGSIVNNSGANYSVFIKGAAIQIDIKWDCHLNDVHICIPTYEFTRLDDSDSTHFDAGWYKKKYDYTNDTLRTALKLYGIQIVVRVSGTGRLLDAWECTKHVGSLLSYFGFAGLILGLVAMWKLRGTTSTNLDPETESTVNRLPGSRPSIPREIPGSSAIPTLTQISEDPSRTSIESQPQNESSVESEENLTSKLDIEKQQASVTKRTLESESRVKKLSKKERRKNQNQEPETSPGTTSEAKDLQMREEESESSNDPGNQAARDKTSL